MQKSSVFKVLLGLYYVYWAELEVKDSCAIYVLRLNTNKIAEYAVLQQSKFSKTKAS